MRFVSDQAAEKSRADGRVSTLLFDMVLRGRDDRRSIVGTHNDLVRLLSPLTER